MTAGSRTWLRRASMKVNEATGDDENLGTLLSPIQSNREAARRLGPSLLLTDFGASMNSTGNDAQAWADAVGMAKSLPYGAKIVLPSGISNIPTGAIDLSGFSSTQQLVIEGQGDVASRVRFNGQDYGFSASISNNLTFRNLGIIGASGGAGNPFSLQQVTNLVFEGITMVGAQLRMPAGGPGACIALFNCQDVFLDRVRLLDNGIANDQCYGIVNWTSAGSARFWFSRFQIRNLAARFGVGLYSMTDVNLANFVIDMGGAANGNGSNNGYPVMLYDINIEDFDRNVVTGFSIKNAAGTGIYTPSSRYTAISSGVIEDVGLNQSPVSLPVGAIALGGDYSTVSDVVIRGSGEDGITVFADHCAISDATIRDVVGFSVSTRYNCEGLVLDNVTGKGGEKFFTNYTQTTLRNPVFSNLRGEDYSSIGMDLATCYGGRFTNCFMQDVGNVGYLVRSGSDNHFEQCGGQYTAANVFDIRSDDSSLKNCRGKASPVGGAQITGARCQVWDSEWWGLGTPGTLTGTVDLTTLTLPADILGKTLIFTSTDYQSGVTVQTLTFDNSIATVSRIIDFVNTFGAGAFASLTAANHLKMRTESGEGTIAITGGTALADLGMAIASNTGAAPSSVEINAIGDDCDLQNNRYTPFGALTGSVVLVAGVATVYTSEVQDGDRIEIDTLTVGGSQGAYSVAITDGVRFVVTSSSATDTSVVSWRIQHRPFRPSDIPTLTYWSRSDPDPAITQVVAGLVTSEQDKSGHGIVFSSSAGTEPAYLGYTASINGVPSQLFDGATSLKTSPTVLSTVIPTPTQFEICAAFQVTAVATNHAPGANYFLNPALVGDVGQEWGLYYRNTAPPKVGIYVFDALEKVAETDFTLATRHWIDAKLDGGSLSVSLDGNAFGAGTPSGGIQSSAAALEKGRIAGGAFFDGYEVEICLFSDVLTNARRTRVRAYFNGRIAP